MTVRILTGDALTELRRLPADSVHCCVTSPPYYGLRDYGMAGQIGLEPTPDEYTAALVAVFREVRRVLRPDGTLWINIGDSYANGGRDSYGTIKPDTKQATQAAIKWARRHADPAGIKPKDLLGIPWMLAFALRADGWWLRQEVIWHKPNPMPESVTDRCTKAHESIFLLAKSERYYFDAAAIAEPAQDWSRGGPGEGIAETFHYGAGNGGNGGLANLARRYKGRVRNDPVGGASHKERGQHSEGGVVSEYTHRNKRSVWAVNTASLADAHFATFPPALIEPAILAGCPRGGTVLDCFAGAGTTGLVADRLGRSAILIELNPAYCSMARNRIADDAGMFAQFAP